MFFRFVGQIYYILPGLPNVPRVITGMAACTCHFLFTTYGQHIVAIYQNAVVKNTYLNRKIVETIKKSPGYKPGRYLFTVKFTVIFFRKYRLSTVLIV